MDTLLSKGCQNVTYKILQLYNSGMYTCQKDKKKNKKQKNKDKKVWDPNLQI